MMDDLKKLLSNAGIQFTENVFTNTDTASSLATEHFVSTLIILVHTSFIRKLHSWTVRERQWEGGIKGAWEGRR